ncbi:MAG: glycosyltransferase involved in cell wall biosynthesis [Cognaticolwellia sp.]|jgi:glycosyltransferase involved in cell wall biosynthesis
MKIKKKVLVISVSNTAKGGVATVVTTFMNNDFLNNEYDMQYFHTHSPNGKLNKNFSLFKACLIFPFMVCFGRFDIAHIHGSLKGSFARKSYFLFWLRLFSIPTIYQCHAAQAKKFFNSLSDKQYLRVLKTFRKYQLCLCLGSNWVQELELLTSRQWNILFNPVAEHSLVRTDHITCNFTFMGELSGRKGIVDLINAFALTSNDNSRLLIAGNGDTRSLQKLCSELDISHKVEILGWVDKQQKINLLKRTDVVVLPSYAEGLPMSILEAMSIGLPVITTPVGSVQDAITHNVHGLLVEAGNVSQITSAINELSYDIDKRVRLGNMGKVKFLENFKDDVVAKKLSEYYKELIRSIH